MVDAEQVQKNFVDYIEAMLPMVENTYNMSDQAHRNRMLQRNGRGTPLKDEVMRDCPPDEVGENWYTLSLWVYMLHMHEPYPKSNSKPIYEDLKQLVVDNWNNYEAYYTKKYHNC